MPPLGRPRQRELFPEDAPIICIPNRPSGHPDRGFSNWPALAETAGIILVAIARHDRFEVFTHPHRIAAEAAAQVAVHVA